MKTFTRTTEVTSEKTGKNLDSKTESILPR